MRRDARGLRRRPCLLSSCDHLCFCETSFHRLREHPPASRAKALHVPARPWRQLSPRPPGWQSLRQKSSSWSRLLKAMRISPLSPLCRIVTFAPSSRVSLSSSASVSASTGAVPLRGRRALAGILAEALDVPDRQALGDDAVGERVRVGEPRAGRARVRPKSGRPPSRARVCSGRLVRRKVLATWLRLLLTTRAMSPCE